MIKTIRNLIFLKYTLNRFNVANETKKLFENNVFMKNEMSLFSIIN